jgi:hypothetical protein
MRRRDKNQKTPNNKYQAPNNVQLSKCQLTIQKAAHMFVNLVIVFWNLFGIWKLEIGAFVIP